MINYRRFNEFDAVKVTAMWSDMLDEIDKYHECNPVKFLRYVVESCNEKSFVCFVAEDNNELAGFILAEIINPKYTDYLTALCEAIYIKPTHRIKGINIKLMEVCMRDIIDRDKSGIIKYFEFYTMYKDSPVKAYNKLGFKPVQVKHIKEVGRV